MPLAARTSRAVAKAGSERAWVSLARKSGPVMFWLRAVLDDGLGDGGDVVVVEGWREGAAAMAGGSEGDALGGIGGVGVEGVVGGDEAREVDQIFGKGELARLVGCLLRYMAGHACVLAVAVLIFATIWDAGCRREWSRFAQCEGGDSRTTRRLQRKVLVF